MYLLVSLFRLVLKLEHPCPFEGAAEREVRENDEDLRRTTGPCDRFVVPQ